MGRPADRCGGPSFTPEPNNPMPVTAQQVKELRQRTGLGMMECKKLLTTTDGDIDAAIAEARKQGVKAKVADRAAGEGRVLSGVSDDGKTGYVVTAKCNTDFTAKSDVVGELLELMLDVAMKGNDPLADEAVKDKAVAASQSTGENVQASEVIKLEGDVVANYQYTINNKTAALVALKGGDAETARQVGLHVVANPVRALAATREGIPADLVEAERQAVMDEVKASGKPDEIAAKITEGKMRSFYGERALMEQDFINPDFHKGTVGDLLKGKGAELIDFKRVTVSA